MRVLRIGAAGLGRAFSLMLPAFAADPRISLVAGADPRKEARDRLRGDFGAKTYRTCAELCTDADVELIYIATPHQCHVEDVVAAAASGKHVLVEKPMALTVADCRTMTEAARATNVQLVVGHSHSFDAPIAHTRALIASGSFGAVRTITAINYTDFLYRPRRPEELDTARGGGVVFNQAAHQIDVVRLLAGGSAVAVRACTATWDPERPVEGAYTALLRFDDGVFATLVYSGYAHFDSDELMGWIGEMGNEKDPQAYGAARKRLLSSDELALKQRRAYGGAEFRLPAGVRHHQHFGPIVVCCERADLRPMPNGVMVYGDIDRRMHELPATRAPRSEVIDEIYAAVVDGQPPLHTGEWAMATMEVCCALLESARTQLEVQLTHQVSVANR